MVSKRNDFKKSYPFSSGWLRDSSRFEHTAHTGRTLSTYIYIADELYVYGHIISKAAVAVAHLNERELLL